MYCSKEVQILFFTTIKKEERGERIFFLTASKKGVGSQGGRSLQYGEDKNPQKSLDFCERSGRSGSLNSRQHKNGEDSKDAGRRRENQGATNTTFISSKIRGVFRK